eukprot:2545448-Prymnesium_polylepis.2
MVGGTMSLLDAGAAVGAMPSVATTRPSAFWRLRSRRSRRSPFSRLRSFLEIPASLAFLSARFASFRSSLTGAILLLACFVLSPLHTTP